MATNNNWNYGNGSYGSTGYSPYGQGMGYGAPRPSGGNNGNGKKGGKKKQSKKDAKIAERKIKARTQRERQRYAVQNVKYRRKVEAVDGRGGIDISYFRMPEDVKPKKGKDYFFVMRKFVCFLMFLILLISIAYFALGFVKIDAIPANYTALFIETEKKAEEVKEPDDEGGENGGEEGGEASNADVSGILRADGDETPSTGEGEEGEGNEGEEGDGEEKKDENAFDGTAYGALDPIFGFLKFVGRKVGIEINLGESPMYDALIAKFEAGMADSIAQYVILAFPVALILYIITAFVMMLKAFFGMFGKRIFKCFGLGSIFMIIFAAVTALGGLAFITEVNAKIDFKGIIKILIGGIPGTEGMVNQIMGTTGSGGFSGGYGLLIILVLPIITLILSMFCRKKVPYSIFDTFGDY